MAHVELSISKEAIEPTTGPPAGAARRVVPTQSGPAHSGPARSGAATNADDPFDWHDDGWARTTAQPAVTSFRRWADTVLAADEPCLVIDHEMIIVAASASCRALLGLDSATSAAGRPLLDAGLKLVDFTAARGELTDTEIDLIPPLLAVTSGRQARGLLRVIRDNGDETVDAIATPLMVDGKAAGSLTFFARV